MSFLPVLYFVVQTFAVGKSFCLLIMEKGCGARTESPYNALKLHVQFWLDKKEAEAFNKKVKRSGLSREAYLRHLVNGLVPQDAPPPAYYDFMRELHRIGGNLNQIAQKAHVLGVIDERRYDEEMRKFDQLVRDITKAVILPRAME